MSFRKFFFSAAAMGVLLLPGITVSASAHSLSDRYTLHQSDSTDDDCTYYDDCTGSEGEGLEEEWYLSQESSDDSDEYTEGDDCTYYDECSDSSDSPEPDTWAI